MIVEYLNGLFGEYIGLTGAGLLIFLVLVAILLFLIFRR